MMSGRRAAQVVGLQFGRGAAPVHHRGLLCGRAAGLRALVQVVSVRFGACVPVFQRCAWERTRSWHLTGY